MSEMKMHVTEYRYRGLADTSGIMWIRNQGYDYLFISVG